MKVTTSLIALAVAGLAMPAAAAENWDMPLAYSASN